MYFIKRVGIAIAFQLFLFLQTSAESNLKITPQCIQAIECISNLKLDKASQLLAEELKLNPNNAYAVLLMDYVDYYQLITSQVYTDYKLLEGHQHKHLQEVRKISKSSPYALYAESEIYLHWAVIKLMHQDYLSGALDLKASYSAIQKNYLLFPKFEPNKKTLGFLKAILGTLPENYNWILGVVGLKGNYSEGLHLIESYINQYQPMPETKLDIQNANFYYVLLHFYYGDKMKAWKHCKSTTDDFAVNPLHCYLRGFIAARTCNNDEAIQVYAKRPKSSEYAPFFEIDLQMGLSKLYRMDTDADIYFKKYVTFYKGKLNMKEAYMKLAWIEWLKGDTSRYKVYRHLSAKYDSHLDDEEKQVANEQQKGILPNPLILKMRLLFDGGYYAQADEVHKTVVVSKLPTTYQQSEFYYRSGRLMQEYKKYSKAITYFTEAIKYGEKQNYVFAPMSTLNLGFVYLELHYPQTAVLYFEKAKTYKNYESKGYVVQRANVGLQQAIY